MIDSMLRPAMLAAMLVTASGAVAQTASFTVRASELRSANGRARVLRHIQGVTSRACPNPGHMVKTSGYRSCVTELSMEMIRSTGSAELLAAYQGRSETRLASSAR